MKTQGTRCNSPQTSMFTLFHLFSFSSCFPPLYPATPDTHISRLLPYFFPPFSLRCKHLIVMGEVANCKKKKDTQTLHSYCPTPKQHAHRHPDVRSRVFEVVFVLVYVCVSVCFLAGEGGTSSFLAALPLSLSLALSLQGLNRSPFWAPATANAADPPLPRSSSSLCYCSSLSFA